MKTNREIFMDRLNKSNMDDFVKLVNAYEKCSRCSNNYWDGINRPCHRNINESSCEDGQKEYFESYPDEDLQKKYNKKYWYCKGYEQARLLKELTQVIYSCGVVEWNGIDKCEICHNKGEKCYTTNFKCSLPFQYLIDLHSNYIKVKIKDLNDIDKMLLKRKMTFDVWLKDTLIPSISDKEFRDKAKHLYELTYVQKNK